MNIRTVCAVCTYIMCILFWYFVERKVDWIATKGKKNIKDVEKGLRWTWVLTTRYTHKNYNNKMNCERYTWCKCWQDMNLISYVESCFPSYMADFEHFFGWFFLFFLAVIPQQTPQRWVIYLGCFTRKTHMPWWLQTDIGSKELAIFFASPPFSPSSKWLIFHFEWTQAFYSYYNKLCIPPKPIWQLST